MSVTEWINDNAGFVNLVLTASFVLFNAIFVWFTIRSQRLARQTLEEMERMHRDERAPRVVPRLEIDWTAGQVVNFVIENTGENRALKVKVTADQDLDLGGPKLGELSFFGAPVTLAANTDSMVALDASFRLLEKNKGVELLTGRIEFQDEHGHRYSEPYSLSLAALAGARHTQDVSMNTLIDQVHSIHRALESFSRQNLS